MSKCRFRFLIAVLILMLSSAMPGQAASDNLALTPPMGWNSWNKFSCDVSEGLIKSIADAIATNGMKAAGYQYVIIDDCWQVGRDAAGNILADPVRFPSGIKALADYVHAKGLKFGIYSCAGTNTCAGRPGGLFHEVQDARNYAAWGVDYLKYDWCNHADEPAEQAYSRMRDALRQSGRPIVFSICEWGQSQPWLWGANVGNLWRTTSDIQDCWDCRRDWGGMGFTHILDLQAGLESFAGPGHWNDPDMLEVGNSGLTDTECKAHFSLWCVLAAPLITGNDVRFMRPEIQSILTNRELIAMDQDPAGRQGVRVSKAGNTEVWAKLLVDGTRAVVLFNRGDVPAEITVTWADLGYRGRQHVVRDLWAGSNLGKFKKQFTNQVAPHDVCVIKVMP